MTSETPREPVRAEDDPHLDWHSDARRIMDEYANDSAYREIAGTQVELLRQAGEPAGVTIEEATALFDQHVALARQTGAELSGTADTFITFLVRRVMLRIDQTRVLRLTSIGHDFLRYMSDRDLPNPPL